MKRSWRAFANGEPGHRFQDDRQRRRARRHGTLSGVLSVVAGIGLIVVGLVALVAPGPGILFVAFGGALVARESEPLAKTMDWLELKLRAPAARALRFWNNAAVPVRALLVAVVLAGTGAAAYGAWRFFLR